jgi:CBS domain-containing protein
MQVKDIMTQNPVCCTKDTSLTDVARMMGDNDCGAIPVAESNNNPRLVGVITDRDIVCRTLADGKNPLQMTAGTCMSEPVQTVRADADVGECSRLMKEYQVRRVFVTDAGGRCVGVVAQADLARQAPPHETASVVKEVSEPAGVGAGAR